jgi:hypothetical protein
MRYYLILRMPLNAKGKGVFSRRLGGAVLCKRWHYGGNAMTKKAGYRLTSRKASVTL